MKTLISVLGPAPVFTLGFLVIYLARELGAALESYSRGSKWTLWSYPSQFYPWLVRIAGFAIVLLVLVRIAQRMHLF